MAQKVASIRRKSEFAQLSERGSRKRMGPVTVTFLAEGSTRAIACAIPKRVGNAVVRNRIRRRIKAIFAQNEAFLAGKYLISVAPEAAQLKFGELEQMLVTASEQLKK